MELNNYNVNKYGGFQWNYLESSFCNTPFYDSYCTWQVGDGSGLMKSFYDTNLIYEL